ncbi:MAG: hypothetical protein M3Z25_00775 [Actinomycetota bacterium]|nr:hypothetical protein [Actinomycetota bacterium]
MRESFADVSTADAVTVARVRHQLGSWLGWLGWPADHSDAVVLDPPPQRDHLHGIPLMRASCDGLSILGTATGTRVTITSTSPDHNP